MIFFLEFSSSSRFMGFLFTEAQLVSKIMYVSSGKVYYFTWIFSFPAMFPSARIYRFHPPPLHAFRNVQ